MYNTIQEAAKDALIVQDACNLSGVAHSFMDVLQVLRKTPMQDRDCLQPTEFVNTHAVVFMFLFKMMSLNGKECLCEHCGEAYRRAEAECKKLAEVQS